MGISNSDQVWLYQHNLHAVLSIISDQPLKNGSYPFAWRVIDFLGYGAEIVEDDLCDSKTHAFVLFCPISTSHTIPIGR